MLIQILGPGCSRCHETERRVVNTVSRLGIAADIRKVTDMKEIMSFGVLGTPAVVIDGKVKCHGRIPAAEEIEKWVTGKS
jgi:small redox-active disulfide protein 2